MLANFHGVFSLILILTSAVIALFYLFRISPALGLAYLGIIIIANPLVLYFYCGKCLCRNDACSHVIPGKLTRFLPGRLQGPYTFKDFFWTALSLVAIFGFPMLWLWQSKVWFVGYWLLLLAGLIEILFFVCRTCRNENCPMCSISEQQAKADSS